MDTKTLVVGQGVLMQSGCYGCEGKVVKVTPSGVDVEPIVGTSTIDALLHFDNNGRSYLTEPQLSDERSYNGTPEQGPWYIVGLISKEEIASTKRDPPALPGRQ